MQQRSSQSARLMAWLSPAIDGQPWVTRSTPATSAKCFEPTGFPLSVSLVRPDLLSKWFACFRSS
jgi:hypothetical protein